MPEHPPRWDAPPATVITGATGWLGRALVEHLLASERTHLRALVRDGEDAAALAARGVEVVTGDVTDRRDVTRLFDGITPGADVIHTAGIIHPKVAAEFTRGFEARRYIDVLHAFRQLGRQQRRLDARLEFAGNPQIVLNQLYKHTQLQDNFGANMLAFSIAGLVARFRAGHDGGVMYMDLRTPTYLGAVITVAVSCLIVAVGDRRSCGDQSKTRGHPIGRKPRSDRLLDAVDRLPHAVDDCSELGQQRVFRAFGFCQVSDTSLGFALAKRHACCSDRPREGARR